MAAGWRGSRRARGIAAALRSQVSHGSPAPAWTARAWAGNNPGPGLEDNHIVTAGERLASSWAAQIASLSAPAGASPDSGSDADQCHEGDHERRDGRHECGRAVSSGRPTRSRASSANQLAGRQSIRLPLRSPPLAAALFRNIWRIGGAQGWDGDGRGMLRLSRAAERLSKH